MGFRNFHLVILLMVVFGLTACMPTGSKGRKVSSTDSSTITDSDDGTTDTSTTTETINFTPKVEIRHLVDPEDGTFQQKVSIPKNFTGLLYLSGINFSTLSDKIVHVKFSFGQSLEPITIPATVATAAGLTPQSEIEVLVMDFGDTEYFDDIRLIYDLFDYSTQSSTSPVQDNRDKSLYCRGLDLDYDPTFQKTTSNTACDAVGERCLYAYAKIVDNGLQDSVTGVSVVPSEAQIDLGSTGYNSDSDANKLKKCLPDNGYVRTSGGTISVGGAGAVALGTNIFTIGTVTYQYQGPYRRINESNWEISGAALVQPYYGIFENNAFNGIYSFLFPRATKLDLNSSIQHLSSSTAQQATSTERSLTTLLSPTTTAWMDGCNARVLNKDPFTNEGVQSCNVTATISIVAKDTIAGTETELATTKEVKLQLVRRSTENSVGEDVLYSNFKTCTSNNSCASDECCFNGRCWDNSLVAQCSDDSSSQGNLAVGATCSSDLECQSLCCDATGRCQVHNSLLDPPVLCQKTPGAKCIAKEWCRQENVTTCLIVNTGFDVSGQQTCALRCYNQLVHGECKGTVSGGTPAQCIPPTQPTPPAFDPANPDCTNAVDPPVAL